MYLHKIVSLVWLVFGRLTNSGPNEPTLLVRNRFSGGPNGSLPVVKIFLTPVVEIFLIPEILDQNFSFETRRENPEKPKISGIGIAIILKSGKNPVRTILEVPKFRDP